MSEFERRCIAGVVLAAQPANHPPDPPDRLVVDAVAAMTTLLTKEQQIDLAWAQHLGTTWRSKAGLTDELRRRLCEQQNWRCCYCGIRMEGTGSANDAPSFEHIMPLSKGGSHELVNLVIACRKCNIERGSEILDVHLLVDELEQRINGDIS
jgi:5-methylcytosine-specific restriction endonuclease McrA